MTHEQNKILFLDIDGVLNSTRSLVVTGCGHPGRMEKKDDPRLDPIAVGLLMEAIVTFDFKIVLSSTWRIGYSLEDTIEMWQDSMTRYYGWPDFPIVGATSWVEDFPRGVEIENWIKKHGPIADYIIVDDDSDMTPEQIDGRHFHHVDSEIGLTFSFIEFCYARQSELQMRRIIGI